MLHSGDAVEGKSDIFAVLFGVSAQIYMENYRLNDLMIMFWIESFFKLDHPFNLHGSIEAAL